MSDPIVIQLQKLAMDSSSNLQDLLRLALLAATKLNLTEFKTWCKYELEGYPAENVPEYRDLEGALKAFNPHYGNIPFLIDDVELNAIITQRKITQSLPSILSTLESDTNSFEYKLPNGAISLLMKMQMEAGAMSGMMPKLIFYKTQFLSILDAVRQEIFKWSLELESQGILGENYTFTSNEKQAAENMSVNNHYNIQNVQGVVGGVSGGTVNQNNQMNVQNGNFDSLASVLRGNNVAESDIQSLKDAIQHDPAPSASNSFGQNVSGWIGGMMGKAANGSWDISLAVAGTLLAEAISKFYGLG